MSTRRRFIAGLMATALAPAAIARPEGDAFSTGPIPYRCMVYVPGRLYFMSDTGIHTVQWCDGNDPAVWRLEEAP